MSRRNRASSRAKAICKICKHRAHGARGLEAHMRDKHPEVPAPLPAAKLLGK